MTKANKKEIKKGKKIKKKDIEKKHRYKSERANKKINQNIEGVTVPALKRLSKSIGCNRLGGKTYAETRKILEHELEIILKDSMVYCVSSGRTTISSSDVSEALKKNNTMIYH
jgi:histone H4